MSVLQKNSSKKIENNCLWTLLATKVFDNQARMPQQVCSLILTRPSLLARPRTLFFYKAQQDLTRLPGGL